MSLMDAGRGAPHVMLTDLLEVENAPALLALCCPQTGIPIWPNIRIAFFRTIMADLLFATGSTAPPVQDRSWRAAGVLGRAAVHNATQVAGRKLRSDVIISTEAIGDELRGGRWYNRQGDPFGDLPSGAQAVVMTNMFEWQWRTPRHNKRIYYHAPIQVSAALVGRLAARASTKLAQAVTALACDRAQAILGWEMDATRRAAFVQWSARKIAALPFRYSVYRRLMQRVRPRLFLGSSGCYGAHAPLFAAARDLGIITAEYQHGAISLGHDAYNFAPAVFASEAYRRTLPQYLLTYGTWWSEQVTAPVECVAIGNPARADKMDKMGSLGADRRKVLVLGDGVEFDLYLNLAQTIARALPGTGLEVALRPHPLERSSVLQRYGGSVDGVCIDTASDIYTSFAQAHSVVSEVSTGLFEAAGLVDRIIVLNTAKARFAFPEQPFAMANSAERVIELIRSNIPPARRINTAEIWDSSWKKNYHRFLAQVGID